MSSSRDSSFAMASDSSSPAAVAPGSEDIDQRVLPPNNASDSTIKKYLTRLRKLERLLKGFVSVVIPEELQNLKDDEMAFVDSMHALNLDPKAARINSLPRFKSVPIFDRLRFSTTQYLSQRTLKFVLSLAYEVESQPYLLRRILRAGYAERGPEELNKDKRLSVLDVQRAQGILRTARSNGVKDCNIATKFAEPLDHDARINEVSADFGLEIDIMYRAQLTRQVELIEFTQWEARHEDDLDEIQYNTFIHLFREAGKIAKLATLAVRTWKRSEMKSEEDKLRVIKLLVAWRTMLNATTHAWAGYQGLAEYSV